MKLTNIVAIVLLVSWLSACGKDQVVAGGDAQILLDGGMGDGASNPDSSPSFQDGGNHDGGFSSDGGFACACDRWGTQTVTLPGMGDNHYMSYRWRTIEVAYDDGDEALGVLSLKDNDLSLEIVGLDGQGLANPLILDSLDTSLDKYKRFGPVVWDGSHYVAFWRKTTSSGASLTAASADRTGALSSGPVTLVANDFVAMEGAASVGGVVFVAYRKKKGDGQVLEVMRLDGDLNVLGTTQVDGLSTLQFELPVSAIDGKVALLGADPDTHGFRWALVDAAGNLTGPLDVSPMQADFAAAAGDGQGKALVCYDKEGGMLACRFMDPVSGQPSGPEFLARYEDTGRTWALLYAGCAYQLLVGWQPKSGQASSFRTYEIDSVGNVKITPFARYWVQPTQTFFAFRSASQGLVSVLQGQPNMAITTARCRPDENPPSCDELNPMMHDMACGGACDLSQSPFDCCTATAGSSGCGPEDQYQHMCHENIDRLACFEALQGEQQCVGADESGWLVPADCALAW